MVFKRPILLVFLLILCAAADPAEAGCASFGEDAVFEMEILSCEPARLWVEKAFAEECSDAAAAQRGLAPPEPVFPDSYLGRWTWARHAQHGGSSLTETVEWQANLVRAKSSGAIVVTTRILRFERFRKGSAPVGAWEKVKTRRETEQLIELPATSCGDLIGKKILFEDNSPCCDVIPTSDLACYLNLTRIRPVEPPTVETQPASQ